ncbi:fimbrillin family protein [Bacteroides hominis]|uniref:fimbrillin family protein n=1 Tax=Bacteroides hominis TaxID=2763023 RepID=UPI00294A5A07|nr:fimbrillin family protein [Bacteroides hominis (ex Liu et al. 2022)]MDV6194177.1 fimbrillin family protein [Bacteroides hominis (ex Liu et al. 2022)]
MMKTNYLTAVALGLLTALCGCQAEDDAPHTPQGTIPIGFSSDVPQTRATKEYGSAADLTDMGVFAYFTNGTFSEGSSTPNFMYNQKVERQADGSWIYSPVRFWPGNTTDKISFFAYAPYVDHAASGGSNPSFQGKTAAGYPQLTYTVPVAEGDQTDLLAAVPLMNRTAPAGEQVKFKLKHALTKVNVGIKSEVGITVTALSVNNVPATATLTFTDSGFDWGSYTGTKTVNATLAGGGTAVTANAADAQSLATFFVLPQKASTTLSITYTQDGTPSMQFTKTDIALPATPTAWEQGMSVGYTLHVKKDGKVTATVGQDWTSESGGEMSGNEKGIASAADWVAFTKLWNAKGLPMMPDGITPDYSLYEDYGWYETDGTNRVFTIKLTASFVLTGVASGELYVPVGTDTHPLTLPIDGQGWQISIDLQNSSQLIEGKYSGIVGYTQSDISNLRVVTIPGNSATMGNSINSSGAIYAGVLAGRADGDILNCSVELVKTTVVNSNTSATEAMYLGGLAGYCGGNIQNSAVFEGSSPLSASTVSFSQASAGSGIGGLAGGVASGKTVGNCYVRLSTLINQAGSTPAAGWLAGVKTGAGFSACHYMSGNTATGCTPDDTSAGITPFTDFTGLCTSLNAEAENHSGWVLWKEVTDTGGTVEQVTLDLYR